MTAVAERTRERLGRAYGGRRSDEDGVLEQVVREHAPLVRKVARRMARAAGGAVDVDDLTSAGMMGLLDAHRRYDPAGGRTFAVYAEFRIRGAILDELRRMDPMTQPMRRKARALAAARRRLEHTLGREPTDAELAAHLELDVEELRRLATEVQPQTFVPILETDDLCDELASSGLDAASLRASLTSALDAIPERSRQVLGLYYLHDLTLREIGQVLEVTEARVCQLHKQALGQLRARLQPPDLPQS